MSCCAQNDPTPLLPESHEPLWLFYDEQCGMCTRSVAWARRHDSRGLLLPFASLSQVAADKLGLPEPRPLGALHAWSAQRGTFRGIDAVTAMLARLPGWSWAARVLRFPPVLPLARWGYGCVAANRHRFGAPVECGLPAVRPVAARNPEQDTMRENR
ncbi:MAG: DUF393 domain-containing protein [Candidatus Eisenbacteria bacterium]